MWRRSVKLSFNLPDPLGPLAGSRPLPGDLRATSGYPLGILKEAEFPASEEIPLKPGDMVVLVTDGIMEARALDGTVFGRQRPVDIVRAYLQATAEQIVDNPYHAVRAFSQNLPQYDDITAAVIKVHSSL